MSEQSPFQTFLKLNNSIIESLQNPFQGVIDQIENIRLAETREATELEKIKNKFVRERLEREQKKLERNKSTPQQSNGVLGRQN